MTTKPQLITHEECGMLMAIHYLVSRLSERTENAALAARMNRVFDMLPTSDPNGLKPD
jgi:hypothetical protein